ncbi:protein translocase subunit SecF [Solicola gregarius]|uniref:Protein-export membrane protein SecF n=1 Tax=Solicola gregarius TaxID=2908642 RepID=A0AA46TGN7_9ACTN|nr:protein translocase subunit SecF [Solicola gregarius]UYM04805.1 protein translocase subunit SecF [Solicola gregarius]
MGRISTFGQHLYEGRISFDFVGRRRLWYAISVVILLAAGLGLLTRGLDMGIEFRGGVEFTAKIAPTDANVDAMRDAVADSGVSDAGDPTVTTSGQNAIRIDTKPLSQDEATKVEASLRDAGASDISQNLIGATWGQQVAQKAAIGLFVFLGLVVIFIWAYFREWKMSVSAIVALIHDLVITVGVYAWSGFEVTPATVTGLLTILGYSLYDTVVVFDKVRENTRGFERTHTRTYAESANLAVNQTLVRSINTSIMALLPVGALLVVGVAALGSGPLKDLSLALFVGMAAGTYSSIFIATPLAVQLKESEPAVREQAKKVERRRARDAVSAAASDEDAKVGSTTAPTRAVTTSGAAKRAQPSRAPRSKRGRRPK